MAAEIGDWITVLLPNGETTEGQIFSRNAEGSVNIVTEYYRSKSGQHAQNVFKAEAVAVYRIMLEPCKLCEGGNQCQRHHRIHQRISHHIVR